MWLAMSRRRIRPPRCCSNWTCCARSASPRWKSCTTTPALRPSALWRDEDGPAGRQSEREQNGGGGCGGRGWRRGGGKGGSAGHRGGGVGGGTKGGLRESWGGRAGKAKERGGGKVPPAVAMLVEGAIVTAVIQGSPDAADVARDA